MNEQFESPRFREKLVSVRDLESRHNHSHQSEMYKRPLHVKRSEKIKELISSFQSGFSFLDAGCAEGMYCAFAVESGAKRVVGIDVSKRKIRQAKKCDPSTEYIVADIFDIRLEEKFELVLCSEVLQHVVEYLQCIKNMISLLAKGGRLVITVPNLSNGQAHEFAKIDPKWKPNRLLNEIGGAGFGRQNALWKFNSESLAQEIADTYGLIIESRTFIGDEPRHDQTEAQAKNIFSVFVFRLSA